MPRTRDLQIFRDNLMAVVISLHPEHSFDLEEWKDEDGTINWRDVTQNVYHGDWSTATVLFLDRTRRDYTHPDELHELHTALEELSTETADLLTTPQASGNVITLAKFRPGLTRRGA